ncbi:MmgE/PrpD family protein [Pseudonocardia sichuanensis]
MTHESADLSADLSATRTLARGAVAARDRPLPERAVRAALAAIVDWTAVTVGGAVAEPATALRRGLLTGAGPCRLPGTRDGASAETAALVNGTAAHTLELDDIYAPGLYHPGAPTIAAALAAGERCGVSGADLVRGVVVGYEVGNRVASTLGAAHYRYWHNTGTAGALAAAAAAAEVLRLDVDRFAHALALAATTGAGLQQTFRSDSMGKPLHSGHAAQAGTVAAFAASAGFTGTPSVLDGEIGMGAVMSDSPSWDAAAAPFGPAFLVERTSVKPYPCCGHVFAAIDAALELREAGVRAEEVTRIEAESYSTALTVAGNPAPTTPFEAKFSIPFVVAHALVHGEVAAGAFTTDGLADERVTALMGRVALRPGAEFDEAFPARRGARVTVVGRDERERAVTVADRRGDPANPVTREQLDAKFRSLVEPVLGPDRAAELGELLWDLTGVADVRSLPLEPA